MRSRIALSAAVLVISCVLGWLFTTGWSPRAVAQESKPGDGNAGKQLPKPDPKFTGKIGETYKDSTASFPLPLKAPKGSPNVLLILLDDVGFGMCSTF